ncbi:MAG: hypothetical protein KDD53_11095 [Bdellovibrionales bacterium]|nr:hypothetical protein [Bdellovibrionales bacterium]
MNEHFNKYLRSTSARAMVAGTREGLGIERQLASDWLTRTTRHSASMAPLYPNRRRDRTILPSGLRAYQQNTADMGRSN